MTADLRAGIEALCADPFRGYGVDVVRVSDLDALLAAHPVQDEGSTLATEAAHAALADAYEAGRRDALSVSGEGQARARDILAGLLESVMGAPNRWPKTYRRSEAEAFARNYAPSIIHAALGITVSDRPAVTP